VEKVERYKWNWTNIETYSLFGEVWGSERNSSGAKGSGLYFRKPLFIKEENVIHNKT
jgi:hypothetical protein